MTTFDYGSEQETNMKENMSLSITMKCSFDSLLFGHSNFKVVIQTPYIFCNYQ